MNKTKIMLAGFAVFASILMLTTTSIAAPVQESVCLEAVEYAEQQLESSLSAMTLKLKNDLYFNSLIGKISSDIRLKSIASAIKNTDDSETKLSLATSYANILKSKPEFSYLTAYIERRYSCDALNVNAQCNEIIDNMGEIQSSTFETEYSGLDAIEVSGVINLNENDDSGILTSGIQTISSIGSSNSLTPSTVLPSDSTQAQFAGFAINMNGEMYIPGMGWIDTWNEPLWMLLIALGLIGLAGLLSLISAGLTALAGFVSNLATLAAILSIIGAAAGTVAVWILYFLGMLGVGNGNTA